MTDKVTKLNITCPHCDKSFMYLHRVAIAESQEHIEEIQEEGEETGGED